MISITTGPALRLLRLRHNLTQADLARRVGVSPTAIHTWETRRVLRKATIEKLERIFNVIVAERGPPDALGVDREADEIDRAYVHLLDAADTLYQLLKRTGAAFITRPTHQAKPPIAPLPRPVLAPPPPAFLAGPFGDGYDEDGNELPRPE